MISVLMLLAVGYASVRKIQQEGSDRNNNTLPVIDVRPDPAQSYFEWLVRNPLVRTLRFEDISSFSVPGSTEYNWARSKPDGSYLEFDSANNQILLKSLDETSTPVIVATSQDMQEVNSSVPSLLNL
jgi:hypothetical protein